MANLGDILREARLRRGLEIGDCESATKIRGKYLRALEENQFEALPGHTFLRGFLKTYADHLGLDGQALVDDYEAEHLPTRETSTFEEVLKRGRSRRRSRESRLLIAVAALALAISTTTWAMFDGPRANASDAGSVSTVFAAAGRLPTYVEAHERTLAGRLLFTPGNIEPGKPISADAALPILIHVGDGSGLQLTIDGSTISLPATSGDFTVMADRTVLERSGTR